MSIKTYHELNEVCKYVFSISDEQFDEYVLTRIEELEQQNKRYRAIIDDILEHAGTYGLRNLERSELKKSIRWAEESE